MKLKFTLLSVLFLICTGIQAQFFFQGQPLDVRSFSDLDEQFESYEVYDFPASILYQTLQQIPADEVVSLQFGSHIWDLQLEEVSLFNEKTTVVQQSESGRTILGQPDLRTYRGKIAGKADTYLRLTVADQFIYGYIREGDTYHYMEPVRGIIESAELGHVVVYNSKDVIEKEGNVCGAEMTKKHLHDVPEGTTGGSRMGCKEVETAIASDYLMFQKYGSISGVTNHITGIMNNVAGNWDDEFNTSIVFLVIEFFVVDTPGGDPWTGSNNAGALLSSFRNWGNSGGFNVGTAFDMGQLWTNRDFSGGTIGIAYLSGICNSNRYHCCQDFSSNAEFLRVLTSHEIGHNFSATHDSPGANFIMAPSVNTADQWSNNSQNQINGFIPSRSCLSDCGGGTPPVADFSVASPIGCAPYTAQFFDQSSGSPLTWSWSFPGGNPSTSNSPNPVVVYDNPGTYDVTLTVTNLFGGDTEVKVGYIQVNALPTALFSSFVDPTGLAIFTNGSQNGITYNWNFGDGNTSTDFAPIHQYQQDGVYDVVLTVTNSCGTDIYTQTVIVATPPVAGFSASPTDGCAPLVVVFQNQSSSNSLTWLWEFEGGTPAASTEVNPVVIYNNPGNFDVSLTVTNSAGINTFSLEDFIKVDDTPDSDFTSVLDSLTHIFTNETTNANSFSWTFGDGGTSTQEDPTHTYDTTGQYQVQLVAFNGCGNDTTIQLVTVAYEPTALFTADTLVGCDSLLVTFADTSYEFITDRYWEFTNSSGFAVTSTIDSPEVLFTESGTYDVQLIVFNVAGSDTISKTGYISLGIPPNANFDSEIDGNNFQQVNFTNTTSGATAFSWNFGDGGTSTNENPTHIYNAEGTYPVQLIVSTECGNDTVTQNVEILFPPNADFSGNPLTACPGDLISFFDNSSGTIASYAWSFPGGTPASANSANASTIYDTPGTYDIQLIVSNAVGSDTLLLTDYVTIVAAPTAAFSANVNGQEVTFTNNSSGANTYSWDFGDGTGSTDENPTHTFEPGATYIVMLTASNACGSMTFEQDITISAAPAAGFIADVQDGCVPLSVQFTDQSTANPNSWDWSFPGGNPSSSSAQNPTVTFNTPGMYDVSLTVTNAIGSDTETQVGYIIVGDLPSGDFTTSISGRTVDFTDNTSGATSYSWDFGDGNSSTDENPSHTYSSDGTYEVVLTVTNACGSIEVEQTVVVATAPTVGFTSDIQTGCADLVVQFIDQSSPNTTSWSWTFTGGTPATSTASNPLVTYTTAGTYPVTLVVSNAVGTDTETKTGYIVVDDIPVPDFSFNRSGLEVSFTNATSNGISYSWDFGDGDSSTDANPTHTYGATGDYTVVLTASNDCGSVTTEQIISVVLSPVANFSSSSQQICAGESITFLDESENNPTSWNWSFAGGTPSTSTDQNPTVTYAASGTYTVSLSASNAEGSDTEIKTLFVTVLDVPTAGFTSNTTGLDISLMNTSQDATSYSWDFGDGTTSTDENPSHTYLLDDVYTVTLTATNACGSVTTEQTITVGSAPIAGFTADNLDGCAGLEVNFSSTTPNATGYNWSFPGGTPSTSTNANPTVTYNAAGSYEVSLTVSNALGSDSQTETNYIVINDVPTADFTANATGVDVSFNNTSQDAISFSWDFGDGATSTEENPSHTYATDGVYTVTLTATNDCGSITTEQMVTITTAPVANFTSDVVEGCAGLEVNFTDLSSSNSTDWSWNFPGGTPSTSTAQNPTVVYATPGLYDVSLTVTNAAGDNTATQSAYIVINDVPTAGFTANATGLDISLTNTSQDATSYSWDFGDGTTSTEENPSHTYLLDDVYTVTLTATNACGSVTTEQTITVGSAPIAGFTADNLDGCAGLEVNFSSTTPNATGYNWSFPGGTPSTSTDANPTVTYNAAGSYEVSLTVSNALGSDSQTETNYIVINDVPTADFTANATGVDVSFSNTSQDATSFSWDFGDGATSTEENPSHTYATDGVYTVTLTATNECGSITTEQMIAITTAPVANFTSDVVEGCAGLEVNFTDLSSSNSTDWSWNFPGGTPSTSTAQNPTVVYATPGVYDVSLTVTNAAGDNTATQSAYIVINDVPTAGFTANTTGLDISLTNTSQDATSYSWDFGDGTTSTDENPSHTYLLDDVYTVTLTATNACGSVTTEQTITAGSAPIAGFTADNLDGCAGLEVNFSSTTPNATGYNWSFPGGTPSTSTNANPTVTYNAAGSYEVSLTVSNALGSDSQTETNYILINDVPTADFTANATGVDVSFSNTSQDATSFSWDFGDGATSTEENPSHTYATDGVYTVTLTATNDCGSITTEQMVTITTAPVANFTSDVVEGCAGLEVNFTDLSSSNSTDWSWNFPGGTPSTSTAQNPTVVYATPGVYDVSLTVTNAAGDNTATQSAYIVINDVPTAGFTANTTGLDISLTNTSQDATSYSWDFGDGTTSTDENPSHTYLLDDVYTVTLTATNACGSVTTEQTITAGSAPIAGFTADNLDGCAGLEVNFSSTTPNATGYNWSFPGGTPSTSTNANPTVTYNAAGSYEVSLTVSNALGSDSQTETNYILINDVPTADFTANATGVDVSFSNTSQDATSFSWDFGDGATSTEENPSHTYATDGVYTVTLTATNDCGSMTTEQMVTITTAPVANFTSDVVEGCAGLEVNFTDLSSSNSTDWSWNFPGGTPSTSTAQNPTVVYATPGLYDVSLTVTNAAGDNTATQSAYIVINDVPTAGFTANATGLDISLMNTSQDATSYSWDFGDGTTSTEENPSHTYLLDDVYTVTLTATNACGSVTTEQTITAGSAPIAGFTSDNLDGCAGLEVNFSSTTPNATGYNWSFPGGTPSTSTNANPTVTYNAAGSYEVSLTVSNALGSDSQTEMNYIVINDVPTADFIANAMGVDVTFNNTSQDATSFSWDFGDGATSTEENPSHTYLIDGTYTVVLTATNDCGSVTTEQTLTIVTEPLAGFSADQVEGCPGLVVQFSDNSSINASSWEWSFPGGSPATSTAQNPVVTYNTPGVYDVMLTVSNAAGSDDQMQTNYISIQALPEADFTTSINGLDLSLTNNSAEATAFNWDFGDGTSSTEPDPMHMYIEDGVYTIQLIATNNCGSDTTTQEVTVVTAPVAGFSAVNTDGCVPFTVEFTDLSSSNTTEWFWEFDGGSPATSTAQNPTVTYNTPGTFAVRLTVSNAAGTDVVEDDGFVKVGDAPEAAFNFAVVTGSMVELTYTGSGATSFDWDFGDGQTSTEPNPTVTYTANGIYEVTLIVENNCGSDTTTTEVIVGSGVAPIADFEGDVLEGCGPLTVNFTNLTQGEVDTYLWSFPGGNPSTSTEPNPTVVYDQPGTYMVTLEVSNAFGSNSLTLINYIEVLPDPVASFTFTTMGAEYTFTNTSTNADEYLWSFGDGNISTDENPVHTYEENGTFTIALFAINACDTVVISEDITIEIVNVGEVSFLEEFLLFPNPSDGRFTLQLTGKAGQMLDCRVFNVVGQQVHHRVLDFRTGRLSQQFNLSDLPGGTYIMELFSGRESGYLKLIIE